MQRVFRTRCASTADHELRALVIRSRVRVVLRWLIE